MKAANLLWCVVFFVAQSSVFAERPPLTSFPSTIGKPAAEVVAILDSKLTKWKREPAEQHATQGSVRFKREKVVLLVQVKDGKVVGTSIGGTMDEAGKPLANELIEALRAASEEVKTAAPAAQSPDSIAARQKEHFDALLKQGFSRAEAVEIVASSQTGSDAREK